jgi:hypothetical protein
MNIVEGNFENKIRLSICIFPSDMLGHEKLSEIMIDYTTFYAHRLKQISRKLDIVYADSIDQGLLNYGDKYKHILFLAAGVRIFDDSIILDIKKEIDLNPDYLAAAHILDWKENWYELHHQFVLVNIDNWVKIGKPKFGDNKPAIDELITIERSDDNFHDNYTPLWIKPIDKTAKTYHSRQGWNFINQAHQNGLTIINWNKTIRNKRTYYYPETNSDIFYNCWINQTYDNRIENFNQQKILSEIITGVADQIWAVNSEHLDINSKNEKFDCIALPASGFKFLDIFKSDALTADGEIIIYDFNPNSIAWIQHLQNSQSNDIKELITTFRYRENLIWFNSKNESILINGRLNPDFEKSFNKTVDYFGENFYHYLSEFRKSKIKYFKVDLIINPYPLISYISDRKTLIQISNIFSTDFLTARIGFTGSTNLINRFINTLHPNTRIVGQSPDGKFISWK